MTDPAQVDEGPSTSGYEPLREAHNQPDHFPHTFAYGSEAYYEWLRADDVDGTL